jgi:hypothetical protein
MALEIYADTYQAMTYDLQAAVDEYKTALAAFNSTEEVPAPIAKTALVARIVRENASQFVIVERPAMIPDQPLPTDLTKYRSSAEQARIIEAASASEVKDT